MMLKSFFSIALIIICVLARAQDHPVVEPMEGEGLVKWMTIEQAFEKSKTEKKNIFIDVYTGWCSFCKLMDKNTFNDPKVAALLNEKFYPVKLDAEQRSDIVLQGKTYKFIASGNSGANELAAGLLNNSLMYPTGVFLDKDFNIHIPIPGYKQPEEFHKILTFFSGEQTENGKNMWTDAGWAEFDKKYKSPYTINSQTGVKQ